MFEHEPDSDDDFECYFLKPVNEYNITDKIKEANQELFETPHPGSPSTFPRKVKFRRILEDYPDGDDNISIVSVESDNDKKPESNRHNLNGIPEESSKEIISNEGSETEDICEEIIEMNLDDEEKQPKKSTNSIIEEIFTNNNNSSDGISKQQKSRNNEILREISLNSRESYESTRSSSEDDDISVIVASYIETPKHDNYLDDDGKKTKSQSIRKFSLRRKKKIPKMNNNKSGNKSKSITTDDVQFNYKNCCEYRNAIDYGNDTLPKYTGYLSEYGLTKEQWEEREKDLEKRKKVVLEKNLKASEAEIQKMDDNERAFTRWLKNKMRFPVNKTKNMFDFKPKKSKRK